jgi:hypothetical protein
MATWTQVTRILSGLEGVVSTTARQGRQWKLLDKLLAWERPLRKSDVEALGDAAPKGEILAVRVPLEVKDALLQTKRANGYFTIPHFNGYPAVLVELERLPQAELKRLLKSAWADRRPASKK